MILVDEICGACGAEISILEKEWKRQTKKDPDRLFYCGLKCAGKSKKNLKHIANLREVYGIHESFKANWGKRHPRWSKYADEEKPFADIMNRLRNRVREKSRFQAEFDLDFQFLMTLWKKQDGRCAISKIEMTFDRGNKLLYPSLDRIDSSKGYTKTNVQFVCTVVNMGKGACSDDDFKEFIQLILKNNC